MSRLRIFKIPLTPFRKKARMQPSNKKTPLPAGSGVFHRVISVNVFNTARNSSLC